MTKPHVRDLIKVVREIIMERPTTLYLNNARDGGCSYESGLCSDNSEGCVFGQGFKKIGWELPKEPTLYPGRKNDELKIEVILTGFFDYNTSEEIEWCSSLQYFQDRKKNWGECLLYANNTHPTI
jgi:hypothetical protein